ncbi:MAG: hypothetical protein GX434_04505 [Peptococcaceae bacterium]|nr:hypothetical protein [Peptococcaceae bacterium]
MRERDKFKDWLRDNLEEEMGAIHFSPEAKAAVKAKVAANANASIKADTADDVTVNAAGSSQVTGKYRSW